MTLLNRLFSFVTLYVKFQVLFCSEFHNAPCRSGTDVIVQLFEWKWNDVALECERFLGPHNFCGVQISPPNENRVVESPMRPWWERYQPVSYKVQTRSGTDTEFREMVKRCNNAGIRVFVDVVINHMTNVSHHGWGTAGTPYHGEQQTYPGVPYSGWDFHDKLYCNTGDLNIHNYSNSQEVRDCRLSNMADLRHDKLYVQDVIVDYLNTLVDIGVAGFHIGYSKYMQPSELSVIFKRLKNLTSQATLNNARPFIYHDIRELPGETVKIAEYFSTGRVLYHRYGTDLTSLVRSSRLNSAGSSWGVSRGMPQSDDVVVLIDNQETQREIDPVYTFRDRKQYEIVNAFMLAYPYGLPHVMSSYTWTRAFSNGKDINSWIGPPHTGNMEIQNISIHSDQTCGGNWVCEHRWRAIYRMVEFRAVVGHEGIRHWWSNGYGNQIAFSRGTKGFVAINGEPGQNLDVFLQTGLPGGTYCDVISGNNYGLCTGLRIFVRTNGVARITIPSSAQSQVIALHAGSKL